MLKRVPCKDPCAMENRTPFRRYAFVALITLLLGLAALFGHMLYLQLKFPARPETTYPTSEPLRQAPGTPSRQETAAKPNAAGRTPQAPPYAAAVGESGPEEMVAVRVVAIDEQGQPVAGVEIEATAHHGGSGRPTTRVLAPLLTDAEGRTVARVPAEWTLDLRLVSEHWFCPKVRLEVGAAAQTVTLKLVRTAPLRVRVTYGDQQPFVGSVSICSPQWLSGQDPQPSHYSSFTSTDARGECSFSGVPTDQGATITAFSPRAGYDKHYHQVSVEALRARAVIEVVIPASSMPKGVLKIDLSAFAGALDRNPSGPVNATAHVRVRNEKLAVHFFAQAVPLHGDGPKHAHIVTTQQMPEGDYQVIVTGEGMAWTSGIFKLAGGEERLLVAAPQAGATVQCTITDATGLALPGAVLRLWEGIYPAWPARAVEGQTALADESGNAELTGLPAGSIDLLIEQEGFEPQIRRVTVMPGNTLQLGRVALSPATGVVLIKLKNKKPDLSYKLGFWMRGEGAPSAVKPVGDADEIRLERVALHRHWIVVLPEGGGKGATAYVELSEQAPFVEVEIDLSTVAPRTR